MSYLTEIMKIEKIREEIEKIKTTSKYGKWTLS